MKIKLKMNQVAIRSTGFAMVAFMCLPAIAGNLPYLGTLNRSCEKLKRHKIIIPSDLKNLTYYTDSTCDTIFVAPPKVNVIIDKKRVSLNLNSSYCPGLKKMKTESGRLLGEVLNTRDEITSGNLSSGEITRRSRALKRYLSTLEEIEELTNAIFGNMSMSDVAGTLEAGEIWTNAVRAMDNANPAYTVTRLPIYGGMIDMLTKSDSGEYTTYHSSNDGVVRQRVLGNVVDDRGLDEMKVIGVSVNYDNKPVAFGGSADFNLSMNPIGGCGLDANGDQVLDSLQSLGGRTAATWTYFFPLETTANIVIKPNVDAITKILDSYLENGKGWVDANRLLSNIKKHGAVEVYIEEDLAGNPIETDAKVAITNQIMAISIDNLLNQIGSLAEMSVAVSNRTYQERHSHTHCKRKWYGSKKCNTHVWYVTKHETNWSKAIKAMRAGLSSDMGSSVSQKRVYMLSNTVGSTLTYEE